LINTWLGEVLWFTGKGWSSWVREEIDRSTVLTERRQWRAAAARLERVRVRDSEDWLISAQEDRLG
jgi:hypothetical protein